MTPEIMLEIGIAIGTFLINIGITKQKVDDMRNVVDILEAKIYARSEELQKRISDCREESLRHAQSYVSRDEFFKSMSELSRDIKTLMRMVGSRKGSQESE